MNGLVSRPQTAEHAARAARRRAEMESWDHYFAEALAGRGQEHERSLWWEISDRDSFALVRELLGHRTGLRVLEAACGSGGTSLLLADHVDVEHVALLDLSANALRFASTLVPDRLAGRVHMVQGDIFTVPFPAATFDLVWNVGVIEHYALQDILDQIHEMRRATRPGGYVVVGIPNRNALAVQKAALLGTRFGRRWLPFVGGYRFDTETLYGNGRLARLFAREFGEPVHVRFGGSCLWVGAPDRFVALVDRFARESRLSFLTFFVLPVHAA